MKKLSLLLLAVLLCTVRLEASCEAGEGGKQDQYHSERGENRDTTAKNSDQARTDAGRQQGSGGARTTVRVEEDFSNDSGNTAASASAAGAKDAAMEDIFDDAIAARIKEEAQQALAAIKADRVNFQRRVDGGDVIPSEKLLFRFQTLEKAHDEWAKRSSRYEDALANAYETRNVTDKEGASIESLIAACYKTSVAAKTSISKIETAIIKSISVDELLCFTTELNTAVEYLLDPENHIQITDEAVFQRIGFIFESAVKRRLEIFHSNHILNSKIVKEASSTPLVAVLKEKFGLSSENAEKLKQVKRNLEEVFAKLKENQLIRQEREKTLRDAGVFQIALRQESRDVAQVQASATSASASAQRSKFDFTIDGQSGNDFQTACQPTADDVYDQCLFYFHNAFLEAAKQDSSSRAYPQVLGKLTTVLNERKRVETEQPNVSVTPSTTPSGIMDWMLLLPLTQEQIQQRQRKKAERMRIEGILSNPQELAAIKARNPEVPKSRVNALETLYNNKDISLIIEESDLAITEGAPNQVAGVEVEPQPREKRSWGVLGDMYRWLTRTPEDKTRYRKGIIAARKHVWSTYGPAAAKRFDAHFALRHRTGSPLTVRALKKFLDHEKTLISGDGSNLEKHSVALIDLNDQTTLGQFSRGILDRAKLEFNDRYYIPERTTEGETIFKRPADMQEISKEDKVVLFENFYREYLQRPVVARETISEEISGVTGIAGFFSTRWSALWMSVFSENDYRDNQQLDKKLIEWMAKQSLSAAEDPTKQLVRKMIEEKRKEKRRLTFEDVNDVIKQARCLKNK